VVNRRCGDLLLKTERNSATLSGNFDIWAILTFDVIFFVIDIFLYTFTVREQSLNELFSQYGEVTSVRIIKDKETRRSKGYGFVEMANDNEANAAIAALNGTEHYERNIVVAEAKGKKEPVQASSEG
jgi:RNA recognition motif-containing protein